MKEIEVEQLLRSLSETRSTEVKRWFDPSTPKGKQKLIKGLQALRNYGGGYFVVGFDDNTMAPDHTDRPSDVATTFHPDAVQELVSKYSSSPFDVEVSYPELQGQPYVVIAVPSGVRTPVATKRDLDNGSGHKLIQKDAIFYRTLNANNRVSSAQVPHSDLAELVGVCFENREADIGRFVRRHLSGLSIDAIKDFATSLTINQNDGDKIDDELGMILKEGHRGYLRNVQSRSHTIPAHGSFEAALLISGDVDQFGVTKNFLTHLDSHNPRLTGWPIWIDSSGFPDKEDRPYVNNQGWEAMITDLESGFGVDHIDFMRKDPSGKFYLYRGLQDDLSRTDRAPTPLTQLDFALVVLRTAETLAVGRSFANAMGCDPETTNLEFGFRWSGLKDRSLSSWANPERYLSYDRTAHQDTITTRVTAPLISAPDSIAEQTEKAVAPLFALFEGFELSRSAINDLSSKLLERRL